MASKKKGKQSETNKNPVGRPTSYRKRYCKEMIEYFEKCQAEIMLSVKFFQGNKSNPVSRILNPLADEDTVEDLKTLNAASVREIEQKLVMQRFPTFIRYARSIGVSKSTLFKWRGEHQDFSDSMDECKEIAEAILLENGLQGTYNSHFAQFVLKNCHGYTDQRDVKHSGTLNIVSEDDLLE